MFTAGDGFAHGLLFGETECNTAPTIPRPVPERPMGIFGYSEGILRTALTKVLNRRDPVVERRMSGQEAAPLVAGYAAKPT